MRRREFFSLVGGAVAWPLGVSAQQPAKLPTIGFLGSTSASSMSQWFPAFVQRLRELGWIEGRTVAIEVRWADERYAEIASEFVRLNVDVIVTSSTPPVIAAKRATAVIPIVSALMGDPVGSGLVASLARPGGNVTGLSNQVSEIAGKRVDLLREVVPGFRGLAFLGNLSNPGIVMEKVEVQAAARALGLDVITLEIQRPEDIAPAFEVLKGRAQALYVAGDPLVVVKQRRWNREPQRLGSLEIDDQLKLSGLLDGQVGRLRPTQNLVDEVGGAPEQVPVIWPIGRETTGFHVQPLIVNRGQSGGDCQGDDVNHVRVPTR